ncbi:replication initiator [Streptomyces sp. NPDC056463]|uniref:replication initiator n=1 Tax=Streptomyces sp. NPDC056463 TaxID=3345827 RepID=UPI0036B567D7
MTTNRAAAARVRVTVVSDAVGERELTWGKQLDVREITAFGTDAEFTDQAVAAYVAKCATKSADASGALDRALFCRPCQGRGATLLPHGTRPPAPLHRVRRHWTDPGPAPPRRRAPCAADDPHLLGAGQAARVRRP